MDSVQRIVLLAGALIIMIGSAAGTSFTVSGDGWQDEGTLFNTTTDNGALQVGTTILDETLGENDGDLLEWQRTESTVATTTNAREGGYAIFQDDPDGNSYSAQYRCINCPNRTGRYTISYYFLLENHDETSRRMYSIVDSSDASHIGHYERGTGGSGCSDGSKIHTDDGGTWNCNTGSMSENHWFQVNITIQTGVYAFMEMFNASDGYTRTQNYNYTGTVPQEITKGIYMLGGGANQDDAYVDNWMLTEQASSGNWTGDTQALGTKRKALDAFQVNVTALPPTGHLDAILEAKDTTNTTTDSEVCHISSEGLQNLSCAANLDPFDNLRWSFNMSRENKSPELMSSTAFYSDHEADTDAWVNESGDIMSGNLDMGGNAINNVGSSDSLVETDGDLMKGILDMGGHRLVDLPSPVNSSDAATKKYVDEQLNGTWVKRSGDNMTGSLNMSGNDIYHTSLITGGGPVLDIRAPTFQIEATDPTGEVLLYGTDLTLFNSGVTSTLNMDSGNIENVGQLSGNQLMMDTIWVDNRLDMEGNAVDQASLVNLEESNLPSCSGSSKGDVRFNDSTHWGCNGTHWNPLY